MINNETTPNQGNNPPQTTVDDPNPRNPTGDPSPTPPPDIDKGRRFGKQ